MQLFENKWAALPLWPLSLLYGLVIFLRNTLYNRNVFPSYKVSKPVISIGNITTGGTGKTPLVIFLAGWLKKKGKRVCILSRGFKRNSRGTLIVSNGEKILTTIDQAGDEPFQMAQELSGVPIIVDEDRVRGAKTAIANFLIDIILLDDGFQHRRLKRDLDILTFKSADPFGNGFLLPAGPLREPTCAVKRANLIWIIGPHKLPLVQRWGIPQVRASLRAKLLCGFDWQHDPKQLAGKRVIAFCGIGSPASFRHTLEMLGAQITKFLTFPDHHKYTLSEIDRLQNIYKEADAEFLITTEKDWVKISQKNTSEPYWCYLKVAIEPDDEKNLEHALATIIDI